MAKQIDLLNSALRRVNKQVDFVNDCKSKDFNSPVLARFLSIIKDALVLTEDKSFKGKIDTIDTALAGLDLNLKTALPVEIKAKFIDEASMIALALENAIEKEKKKNEDAKKWHPAIQKLFVDPANSLKDSVSKTAATFVQYSIYAVVIAFVGVPLIQLGFSAWVASASNAAFSSIGITANAGTLGVAADSVFNFASIASAYTSAMKFAGTALFYVAPPVACLYALNKVVKIANDYIVKPSIDAVKVAGSFVTSVAGFVKSIFGGLVSGAKALFDATALPRFFIGYRAKKHLVPAVKSLASAPVQVAKTTWSYTAQPVIDNVASPIYSSGKNAMAFAYNGCRRKPLVMETPSSNSYKPTLKG